MSGQDRGLDLLGALVLPDGSRWGEVATSWQWGDAAAMLDVDSSTPYHFNTRPRGGSKTTDAAAICVVMLARLVNGRLYGVAADRDQAALLLDALAGLVRQTPSLPGAFEVTNWRVTCRRTGSVLQILAADAPGSWGLSPDLVVADEVAAWPATRAARVFWESLSTAVVKRPGAKLVCITSPGDPSGWAYRVLEHARSDRRWRVSEVEGPVPWLDPDRLEELESRLPESSYQRLVLGRWASDEDRLVDLDDLRAAVTLDRWPLSPRPEVRYVIGLDVGVHRDATAVAVVHAEPIGLDEEPAVLLDLMRVWQPVRGKQEVRLDSVESFLADTSREYNHAPIAFDPSQAELLSQRLRDRGIETIRFPITAQSGGRVALQLHTLLRNRLLRLPDEESLLDELAGVRFRTTSIGTYRMENDPDRHDDRAWALGIAAIHLLDRREPDIPVVAPQGDVAERSPWVIV